MMAAGTARAILAQARRGGAVAAPFASRVHEAIRVLQRRRGGDNGVVARKCALGTSEP